MIWLYDYINNCNRSIEMSRVEKSLLSYSYQQLMWAACRVALDSAHDFQNDSVNDALVDTSMHPCDVMKMVTKSFLLEQGQVFMYEVGADLLRETFSRESELPPLPDEHRFMTVLRSMMKIIVEEDKTLQQVDVRLR